MVSRMEVDSRWSQGQWRQGRLAAFPGGQLGGPRSARAARAALRRPVRREPSSSLKGWGGGRGCDGQPKGLLADVAAGSIIIRVMGDAGGRKRQGLTMRHRFRGMFGVVVRVAGALRVTKRHWIRRPAPNQGTLIGEHRSPGRRLSAARRFRGLHRYDLTTCIACGRCARGCPVGCIHVGKERVPGRKGSQITRFAIDYARCVVCGLCTESCPVDCIRLDSSQDLSRYFRDGCMVDFSRLPVEVAWGGSARVTIVVARSGLGAGPTAPSSPGQLAVGRAGRARPETRRRTRARVVFTIEEANAALPLVRAIVTDLAGLSREVIERRRRLSTLLDRGARDAGDPYREELAQIAEELKKDSRRLQQYVAELRELGVEPTSGPEGLVDFPAIIDGRGVFLCWKLGEPEVLYWHEMDAGFRERQPLAATGRRIAHWSFSYALRRHPRPSRPGSVRRRS